MHESTIFLPVLWSVLCDVPFCASWYKLTHRLNTSLGKLLSSGRHSIINASSFWPTPWRPLELRHQHLFSPSTNTNKERAMMFIKGTSWTWSHILIRLKNHCYDTITYMWRSWRSPVNLRWAQRSEVVGLPLPTAAIFDKQQDVPQLIHL